MTEQEVIDFLKNNKTKGIAYLFLPKEVKDWVDNNFNCISLLALQRDGEWDLVFNHDYDSYSNIVFALPDDYETKKENKGECEEESEEESEQKHIADSMLLAARVLRGNCIKINCQKCVLCRNEECILNLHPLYWNI